MYSKTELIDIVSIKTLYMTFDRKMTELEVKFSEKIQFNILYVEQQLFDAGKEALSLRQ